VSDPIFEIREVEAGYGRAALVLRGLSISVDAGTVVCLVGPNGAGKSTVLKVASGLLAPRSGRVLLRGEDVTGASPQRLLAAGVAHVLQGHSVFREMTVEENVRLGAYIVRGHALVEQRCRRVQKIFPVVGERWKTAAGLLSGGQQKQVELARALMLEPAVVLLDEPSMGLDPKATAIVFDQIARMREIGNDVPSRWSTWAASSTSVASTSPVRPHSSSPTRHWVPSTSAAAPPAPRPQP
jgi:branched-chain amino acid transport system ATP-binding protein